MNLLWTLSIIRAEGMVSLLSLIAHLEPNLSTSIWQCICFKRVGLRLKTGTCFSWCSGKLWASIVVYFQRVCAHLCLLFVIPWSMACQAPLSMRFSWQEYWSGLHFLLHGIFLTWGLNPCFLLWQADSVPLSHLRFPSLLSGYPPESSPDPQTRRKTFKILAFIAIEVFFCYLLN